MSLHPTAAQSLLNDRPSPLAGFVAVSVGAHVIAVLVFFVFNWLFAPKIVDLDQKPIKASLVRLGKKREEKLLPRKDEPPPPPKEEKAPVAVPTPAPAAVPVPSPVAVPVPDKKAAPSKQDGKQDARKSLFAAFDKTARAAKPEELEGAEDGDPNGDAAREEGERYFGLISSAVRRYYDVSNTIPEAERRTLKAEVSFKVSASGEVTDVKLKKPSGNDLFDDAVIGAVKKAAPFSAPPKHLAQLLKGGVTLVFSP